MKFSANLGFLWSELPLPDAVRAAKRAGFSAVEFHWPYNEGMKAVKQVLKETSLPLLSLNTRKGRDDENGFSALPDRVKEAQDAIDEAIFWATNLQAENIHVMAGFAAGKGAYDTFLKNLDYACVRAERHNLTILIEPLNAYDAPGYFLKTTKQAEEIIKTLGHDNLKLMFDCYHVQVMEGDLTRKLQHLAPIIGHIQFAAPPHRGSPEGGEINFAHLFQVIKEMGWKAPLGAEYKPEGKTEDTLGWMKTIFQSSQP